MSLGRKISIASGVTVLLIGGLATLSSVMGRRVEHYVTTGDEITLPARIAFEVVFFWDRFWFLLAPLFVLLLIGGVLMQHVLFSND